MDEYEQLFTEADSGFLGHLTARISEKAPSFVTPLNMFLKEGVQVAYLLNQIINSRDSHENYKTFFCNSHIESVHGAIKLARHFSKTELQHRDGKVLFYDPSGYYQPFFDPAAGDPEDALVPAIKVVDYFENIAHELISEKYNIIVFSVEEWPAYTRLNEAMEGQYQIIKILDLSRVIELNYDWLLQNSINSFDIICWGEAMTRFQTPFGAFSARSSIYKVWDNPSYSLIHSTTFGGNGVVLSYVLKNILSSINDDAEQRKFSSFIQKIEWDRQLQIEVAKKYLNIYSALKFKVLGIDCSFSKANGSFLQIKNGSHEVKILDCVGGSGCNAFGHNSDDLTAVINEFNPECDYFELLLECLKAETKLSRMFQGVSGASVVEMAITIARLAVTSRKKIVVFKGNFGGKTLAALNVTSGNHIHFGPLYKHVEVLDVFSETAADDLKSHLTSGEVGLVWLEFIQGGTLTAIPAPIISIINNYKQQYRYLVGVDEILNGIHRTGPFTSFNLADLDVDFVTFAKALSGMVMPISALMCKEEVYLNASKVNAELVKKMENLYKNQLSCHLAVSILNKIKNNDIQYNVEKMSGFLTEHINVMTSKSTLIKKVTTYGFHIHIHLNLSKFPFNIYGSEKSNAILSEMLYKKGHLLSFFGRLLPPLNLSLEEGNRMVKGLSVVFACHPLYFWFVGLKQIIRRKRNIVEAKLKRD